MTAPLRPRVLRFLTLSEAVTEAETLLAGGYVSAGKWDLAQVCGHLAQWATFPLDGFPPMPWPVRAMMWVMRNTVAPGMLRKALASGKMAAGSPTMPETVPPPGGDPAAAVAAFRAAVERFEAYEGPWHPSPMFGAMDKETLRALQTVHAAHHLAFLVPEKPDARADGS